NESAGPGGRSERTAAPGEPRVGRRPVEAPPADPAVWGVEGRDAPDLRVRGPGWGTRDHRRGDPGHPDRQACPRRSGPGRGDRAVPPEPGQLARREGPTVTDADTRAELFAAFRELGEAIPEMRAGQLVAAVGELCADLHGRGLWDASDAELLEAVWQFRRNFEAAAARANERAEPSAAADPGRT